MCFFSFFWYLLFDFNFFFCYFFSVFLYFFVVIIFFCNFIFLKIYGLFLILICEYGFENGMILFIIGELLDEVVGINNELFVN